MKSVPLFGSNGEPAPACPGGRGPAGAGGPGSCSCPGPMMATWCSLYREQSASGGNQFTVLSSTYYPMVFVVDGDSLRHHGPTKRRGREDRIQHAWPLRCWLHPPHLYMLLGRSRTRQPRPWVPSWNKLCKSRRKKQTGDVNLLSGTLLSVISFRRVGHGVGRDFFSMFKSNLLQQKTPEIRRFQVFSGAAGQIRTADLILTKDALYRLSYSSKWRPRWGSNPRPPA